MTHILAWSLLVAATAAERGDAHQTRHPDARLRLAAPRPGLDAHVTVDRAREVTDNRHSLKDQGAIRLEGALLRLLGEVPARDSAQRSPRPLVGVSSHGSLPPCEAIQGSNALQRGSDPSLLRIHHTSSLHSAWSPDLAKIQSWLHGTRRPGGSWRQRQNSGPQAQARSHPATAAMPIHLHVTSARFAPRRHSARLGDAEPGPCAYIKRALRNGVHAPHSPALPRTHTGAGKMEAFKFRDQAMRREGEAHALPAKPRHQ